MGLLVRRLIECYSVGTRFPMQHKIRSVAVFCGSRSGRNPKYASAAADLGRILARAGVELIFGAGHIGLMGVVADAALAHGGKVAGMIPKHLVDWELAHPGITELIITKTMHERKAAMAERADAFVALPGGFGTCDEFFEILTWRQLHLHQKPIALVNTRGFFTPMLDWVDHMVREGFLKEKHREMIAVADTPESLWHMLENYKTESVNKLDQA